MSISTVQPKRDTSTREAIYAVSPALGALPAVYVLAAGTTVPLATVWSGLLRSARLLLPRRLHHNRVGSLR
jgi:hypothetical protein